MCDSDSMLCHEKLRKFHINYVIKCGFETFCALLWLLTQTVSSGNDFQQHPERGLFGSDVIGRCLKFRNLNGQNDINHYNYLFN